MAVAESKAFSWFSWVSDEADRVVALTKEGFKPSEICAELEINKSTVSRHLRKARELGDVRPEARP
jgi:putative DNA primase/helicase